MHDIHKPVLLDETLEFLKLSSGSVVVDATFGAGGHTKAILNKIGKEGKVIAFDKDISIIERVEDSVARSKNLVIVNESFGNIESVLDRESVEGIDACLFDLGVSSWQIDSGDRGFSYSRLGELDMRMDQRQELRADIILNTWEQIALEKIWKSYSDLKEAKRIARKVVETRKTKLFQNTDDLLEVIKKSGIKTQDWQRVLARVWQGLRMEVNDELGEIRRGITGAINKLNAGSRLVVITFHSVEDRLVKEIFREESRGCVCPKRFTKCVCDHKPRIKIISKKPLLPSENEMVTNNRSHSAKMRVVEKI